MQPEAAYQRYSFPPHVTGVLEIDTQSIVKNYKVLKSLSDTSACIPVIKSNAYGFGLREVTQLLIQKGCNAFFVAHLEEGLELRKHSQSADIYVLSGTSPNTEGLFSEQNLTPVLNSYEMLNRWVYHSKSLNRRLSAVVHFDTGMHRLGFDENDTSRLIESSQHFNALQIHFMMSHLASSGNSSDAMNEKQRLRFEELRQSFPQLKASLADTGGIYLGKPYHYDITRPGKGLFGLFSNPDLEPCLTLHGQVLQTQTAKKGESVGYGGVQVLARESRLATIGIGFADGYDRRLTNQGHVQIAEFKASVVGRISMDYTVIDITDIPESLCYPGSWVELIGKSNNLDVLANAIGTISRELSTGFSSRLHRIYS